MLNIALREVVSTAGWDFYYWGTPSSVSVRVHNPGTHRGAVEWPGS
jgi:hypothetical protein